MSAKNISGRLNPKRVIFAFPAAPVTGSFVYSAAYAALADFGDAWVIIFCVSLMISTGCTVFLGVPAYFFLRRRVRPSLANVALLGGCLSLVPFFFLLRDQLLAIFSREDWLVGFLQLAVLVFASGLVGGFGFWFCAFWRNPA